eukprot:TRINITY_DN9719_c0_g1_i3.p1 TRINITY_DN9719_c0_g1~~TRINITY_DN9719_c0_g1_i3.p1  ORF type:complete len:852 (-),score=159.73 TRINITY_DN9719_c0_g1_i3:263-2818(-)
MPGLVASVLDSAYKSTSNVIFAKETVIVNSRLGMSYRAMQFGIGLYVVYSLSATVHPIFTPMLYELDVWIDSRASDGSASYCESSNTYDYQYSTTTKHSPRGCRPSVLGSDYAKSPHSLFIATRMEDSYSWSAGCSDSSNSSCAALDGTYSTGSECSCSSKKDYFVPDVEKTMIGIRHGYRVQYTDNLYMDNHYLRSVSNRPDAVLYDASGTESTVPLPLLTVFRAFDGSPCKMGGKNEFSPKDGESGIVVPLEDLLACGGLKLDDRSVLLRGPSHRINDVAQEDPTLRLAGAALRLNFTYYKNSRPFKVVDPEKLRSDGVVCAVTVIARTGWQSRVLADAWQPVEEDVFDANTGTHFVRHAHGVNIEFGFDGYFANFSLAALLQGLINAIVMLSIPVNVVRMIALYGVGLTSSIYYNVLRERFAIINRFHGLSARMMTASAAFKSLTSQLYIPAEDLAPLMQDEIATLVEGTFATEMQKGILDTKECEEFTYVMMNSLDPEDAGAIDYSVFVHACSSGEAVRSSHMTSFFDLERNRAPGEIIFDDTRGNIRKVASQARKYLEANLEGAANGAINTLNVIDVFNLIETEAEAEARLSKKVSSVQREHGGSALSLEARLLGRGSLNTTSFCEEDGPIVPRRAVPSGRVSSALLFKKETSEMVPLHSIDEGEATEGEIALVPMSSTKAGGAVKEDDPSMRLSHFLGEKVPSQEDDPSMRLSHFLGEQLPQESNVLDSPTLPELDGDGDVIRKASRSSSTLRQAEVENMIETGSKEAELPREISEELETEATEEAEPGDGVEHAAKKKKVKKGSGAKAKAVASSTTSEGSNEKAPRKTAKAKKGPASKSKTAAG